MIVPIALIELWRHGRWRSLGAGVGATIAVGLVTVGPFALIAPHGIWWSIHREASRHLETESLGASIRAGARYRRRAPARCRARRLALARGSLAGCVRAGAPPLTVVALMGIYVLFWRSSRSQDDIVIACAAAVTAYVLFSKVFSPQYVMWLVPLVPLVGGRRGLRASVLLVAILGVTQIFEPYRYFQYWHFATPWLTWTVVFRNLLWP